MNNQNKPPIWFKGTMPSDWVTRFTVGNDHIWDTQLLPYDAEATRAHAQGLVRAGILSQTESDQISESLRRLTNEWKNDRIGVSVEDEDCHTVIERWLTEDLGDVGKKVHTARSRNDQVLAALRLWIGRKLDLCCERIRSLVLLFLDTADSEAGTFLPGYTHMQRAMPSSVGLWAAGFAETLCDDLALVREARRKINISPLGSAAGYGVPGIALDREYVADLLGFEGVQENATTVQLSRGKLELTVVHALLQVAFTLNRLASDLVLFSTSEYAFVTFDEAHTTGSSIMPQKRNADVAELGRAALHRIAAEAQVLIGIPANLTSGYHRDLQHTKEAVMRAVLSTDDLLSAMGGLCEGLSFDRDRLDASRDPSLFATEAVMKRVTAGESFREAYQAVGKNPDEWIPKQEDSLEASYLYDGTPGRPVVERIRTRLQELMPDGDS